MPEAVPIPRPRPPPGFTLDAVPPPPAGFVLDTPRAAAPPPPPPGFVLDVPGAPGTKAPPVAANDDGGSFIPEVAKGIAGGVVGTTGTMVKGVAGQVAAVGQEQVEIGRRQLDVMDRIDRGEDVFAKPSAAPAGDFAGLVEPGNIDVAARPVVKNADGSISTVRSASFNLDGKEVLIPTVSPDGRILTNRQAVELYRKTGQHLGKFDTPDQATAYSQALHEAQAKFYGDEALPPDADKMARRYAQMSPEARKQARAEYESAITNVTPGDITQSPIFKAGQSVQDFAKTQFPAAKDYEDTWTRSISEGLGSTVPFLATAVMGPAGPLVGATAGSFTSSGEAIDRAIEAGATKEQIIEAVRLGGVPGLTEQLPIETLFERIPLPLAGKFAGVVGKVLGQAAAEGGQEAVQQAAQNLIARYVYKPDQDLTEGVLESAAIGGIVGGGLKVGEQGVSAVVGGKAQPATEVDIPAPPDGFVIDQPAADENAGARAEIAAAAGPESVVVPDSPPGGSPSPAAIPEPVAEPVPVPEPVASVTPAANPAQRAILRRMKWTDSDIDQMSAEEVAAEVESAGSIAPISEAEMDSAHEYAGLPSPTPAAQPQDAQQPVPAPQAQPVAEAAPEPAPVAEQPVVPPEVAERIAQIQQEEISRGTPAVAPQIEQQKVTSAEIAAPVVAGADIDGDWTRFTPESGTLNVPRSEMPQIKAEHRGAMVQFLAARGIEHQSETIPAGDLKPTQAEFSLEKVEKAKSFEGGDRSILVSSDGYVLDGHHQWLAKLDAEQPVDVIRLDAPMKALLPVVSEFPSATTAPEPAAQAALKQKIKAKRERAPLDIMQFIASEGGLNDFKGEIKSLGLKNHFVPGVGKLMREKGMDLDRAREKVEEAGYIGKAGDYQTTTVADLLDALDKNVRGQRVYAREDAGRAANLAAEKATVPADDRWQENARAEIEDTLGKIEEPFMERILAAMRDHDLDAGDAIERAALQSEVEDDIVSDDAPAAPFFEDTDEVQRGAAPESLQTVREDGERGEESGSQGEAEAGSEAAPARSESSESAVRAEPDQGRPVESQPERKPEEVGAEGRPQLIIPGAERITRKQEAERAAAKPMRPKAPQKDAGELFDEQARAEKQEKLFSLPEAERSAWQKHFLHLRNGTAKLADFVVLRQSPVLASVIGGKGRVSLNTRRFGKIRADHPDVPLRVWAQLPEMIADPRFVFVRSGDRPAVVLVARGADGSNIIVGVEDGEITTVTPWHSNDNETSDERLARELAAALARPGKVYAVSKEALDEILKLTGSDPRARPSSRSGLSHQGRPDENLRLTRPNPADLPSSRTGMSHQGRKAKVITREDVVKSYEAPRVSRVPAAEAPPRISKADEARVREIVLRVAGIEPEMLGGIRVQSAPEWGITTPQFMGGLYDPTQDVVAVALYGGGPKTAYHESFHRLQRLFLNERERQVLAAETERLRQIVATQRPENAGKMSQNELEAEAFAIWSDQMDRNNAVGIRLHIAIRRAWERIRQALRRVRNALNGMGYQTAEDVFGRARAGKTAKRAPVAQPSAGPEYSLAERVPSVTEPRRAPGALVTQRISRAMQGGVARMKNFSSKDRGTRDDGEFAGNYLVRKWEDYLRPLEAMQKSVGVPLNDLNDAYLNARLMDDEASAAVQTMHDKYITPIIDALVAGKASLEEFHKFLYALHAEERNRVVGLRNPVDSDLYKAATDPSIAGASGMSTNQANAIIAEFRKDVPKYRALRQAQTHARAMLDQNLKNQRAAGLISSETYDLLTKQWENYVPLKGQEGMDEQGFWKPGKSGFDARGDEFKTALGRFSEADNVIAHAITQNEQSILRQVKNGVIKAQLRFLNEFDPKGENLAQVYWAGEDGLGDIIKAPDVYKRVIGKDGIVTMKKVPNPFSNRDDVVAGKVGGKTYYIRFKDPKVGLALRKMGMVEIDAFTKLFRPLTVWQSIVNTRANPVFAPKNIIRDALVGFLHLMDDGFSAVQSAVIVAKIPRAWVAVWKNSRNYSGSSEWDSYAKEFVDVGGKITFNGYRELEDNLRLLQKQVTRGIKGENTAAAAGRGFLKFITDLSDAGENGIRLSAYIANRKRGLTAKRSGLLSRELTVDFKKHGEFGPFMNSWFVFFNASLLGGVNISRRLLRSRKIQGAVGALIFAGMMQHVWNSLVAGDDEDGENAYKKMLRNEGYKFERQWVFFIPGTKDYVSFPMAFGYNAFVHLGMQGAAIMSGDKAPMAGIADAFRVGVDAFNPIGSGSLLNTILPTVLDPVVDIALNEDFAGREIYPGENRYDPAPPPDSYQSKKNTDPKAKWAAEFMNTMSGGNAMEPGLVDVHPDTLEYLWGFFSGGLGRFASQTGQSVGGAASGELEPSKVPFVKDFYGQVAEQSQRTDYFRHRAEVQWVEGKMKEYQETGVAADIERFQKDHKVAVDAIGPFKGAEKARKDFNKQRRGLEASDMTAAEKKVEMDKLDKQELDAMRDARKEYVKAQQKYVKAQGRKP